MGKKSHQNCFGGRFPFSKKNECVSRSPVHLPHLLNLFYLLDIVFLIDTDTIGPNVQSPLRVF